MMMKKAISVLLFLAAGSAVAQVNGTFNNVNAKGDISNSHAVTVPGTLTGDHGSGPKIQLSDGTGTTGHVATYDASGNVIDGGVFASITWSISDVTSARSIGTIYQNTSSNPMYMGGSAITSSGSSVGEIIVKQGPTSGSLSNVIWDHEATATVAGANVGFTAVIMPGYYYQVTTSGPANINSLNHWIEITGTGSTGSSGGGGGGSGPTIQTNGASTSLQSLLNFVSGNGFSFSNPSGGIIQVAADGSHYLPTLTDQTNWNSKQASGAAAGGDLTGTYPNPALKSVSTTYGSCGDASHVCSIITDANGRVLSQSVVAITGGGGGYTPPTGTGFPHITTGAQDAAARAVNLASSDVTGLLPNSNLANASITINGVTCALGASCTIPAVTDVTSTDSTTLTTATSGTTRQLTVVSAPKLKTARTINGVAFDGTANITIAAGSTPTGTGFSHITGGTQDAAARAVSLASTDVTGLLPVTNGGTGTASPTLSPGTGISVTGTWPNQTIGYTGSSGCPLGTCIQNNPTATQGWTMVGTHMENAYTNWNQINPPYGGAWAVKNFFYFNQLVGNADTQGNHNDTFVTTPGWSRAGNSGDWGWLTYTAHEENSILSEAGIKNGYQLLMRANGNGDVNGLDMHFSTIGGATALSDEGYTGIQNKMADDAGPKITTISSGGGVGATSVGMSADNFGAGAMLLNTSSSRVFTNTATQGGTVAIQGGTGGSAQILVLGTPLTSAQTGFGCGTTTADVVPANPFDGSDISVTLGINLASAYAQTSPTIAGAISVDFNGSILITGVGSYSGGVQTVTASISEPLYAGTYVCIGGIANSAMQNTGIASWSNYMAYVTGAIDSTHIVVSTLNQGRNSRDYVEAGNIAIFPMAFVRAADQNTNTVLLHSNNVAWNTGDSVFVPNAAAQIYNSMNFGIGNHNPHAQVHGIQMVYSGVPFRFSGGGANFSIQGVPASSLPDFGASGCYNAGTCGAPLNLFDIKDVIGAGLYLHNFPENGQYQGNTIRSSVNWVSCETQSTAHTCQTDLNWLNYHDFSSQGDSFLSYNVAGDTWNFINSSGAIPTLMAGTATVCTSANYSTRCPGGGGGGSVPTGTGFYHVTGGVMDAASRAVNLASSDVSGLLPNANLANPSVTINSVTCTLGGTCTISAGLTSFQGRTTAAAVLTAADVNGVGAITNATSGNAATATLAAAATKLATARTINGTAFDGTANVTVTADATTLTGSTLKSTVSVPVAQVTGLAASATTDTTNASNITSGTLPSATLPLATTAAFGAIKPDGTTCTTSAGVLSCTGSGGGSGLSGMTAGQVPIAATSSTVTSSMPLGGAGAVIVTGPTTGSVTNLHIPTFTGTTGQIQDSTYSFTNLCIVTNGCSFTLSAFTRPAGLTSTNVTAAASILAAPIVILSGTTSVSNISYNGSTSSGIGFVFYIYATSAVNFVTGGTASGGVASIGNAFTTVAGQYYQCIMPNTGINQVFCK